MNADLSPKCPVCGVTVDTKNTSIVQIYKGQMLFFDKAQCLRNFKQAPERYLAGDAPADDGQG